MTAAEIRSRLRDRLQSVEERIAAACQRAGRARGDVTLVAVTKAVNAEVARLLPELGVRDLGESRPQELWRKVELLQGMGVRWHLVGHLQRNKIEPTIRQTYLIHSADSRRLMDAINSYDESLNTSVLLEVNVSREANKHGFTPEEVPELVKSLPTYPRLRVEGLMTMAALGSSPEQARQSFRELRQLRDQTGLKHLSMGMTNDFEAAIEEGATFIRLGTILFEGFEEPEV